MVLSIVYLNEEIGKRIAALRSQHEMTQEILAQKLNCSIKHISHVERGVASFSLDMLIEVSELFDCTLDYLVKGEASSLESQLPAFILKILSSKEARMEQEKKLLLEYLNMYRKLRLDGTDMNRKLRLGRAEINSGQNSIDKD